MPDCPICIDSKRATAIKTCPRCSTSGCVDCMLRTATANALVPECVGGCKNLNDGELKIVLGVGNFSKKFKPAYHDALLAREKNLIPLTMGAVETVKRAEKAKEEMEEVRNQIQSAEELIRQLNRGLWALREKLEGLKQVAEGASSVSSFKSSVHCQKDGCRGYADLTGHCLVCGSSHCVDCGVMTNEAGPGGEPAVEQEAGDGAVSAAGAAPHKCDPNEVATMKELSRTAKPCPNCGAPVTRISGCPQMWCTHCHVGFKWDTLKISKGAVSNPERDDFMRGQGWNVMREVGDIPCGGFPEFNRGNLPHIHATDIRRRLGNFHRRMMANEIINKAVCKSSFDTILVNWWKDERRSWMVRTFQTPVRYAADEATEASGKVRTAMSKLQAKMTDMRVQFILKRISEEEYKKFIVSNESKIRKEAELMHIHQSYATMLQDLDRDWFGLLDNIIRRPSFEANLQSQDYDAHHDFVLRIEQIKNIIDEALELGSKKLGIKRLGVIRRDGRLMKS